jgi:uncharacterized membrane protein
MTIDSKARFEQFSDGVFAIAITLLALELHVPTLDSTTLAGAARELVPLIPNILTFFISFFTIAIFWVNHHQLTQEIGPLNRRTIWTNMLLLFFVTLIPFVIQAARENQGHPLAVMTFAAMLFGASSSFTFLRYFVHQSLGETHIKVRRSFIGPTIYFFAVLACAFWVDLAYILLFIPPIYYFLPKQHAVQPARGKKSTRASTRDKQIMLHSLHISQFTHFYMTFIRRMLLIFVVVYFFASAAHLIMNDTMQVVGFENLHLAGFRIGFAAIALIIALCILWRPLRMMGTLLGSAYLGGALVIAFAFGTHCIVPALALLSLWVVLKLSWWKHWCLCGQCEHCTTRLNAEMKIKEFCDCGKKGCKCERGKCTC